MVRRGGVRARSRRSRSAASSWPSAMSRSRTSRATSASVRPTSRPAAIWATTRSAAWAASVSSAISSASLTIRSRPRIGEASSKRASGEALLEAQQVPRREVVGDGDPERRRRLAARVADHRRRRARAASSVSSQVTTGRSPAAAGGHDRAGVASSRGATSAGLAAGRDDEHRQALERHRRVAGQVAQVGPDADEERGEAGLAGEVAGGRQPVAVALGRDGRAGRRSCGRLHAARSVASHAASWRGPSSNRRRYGWTRSAPAASARRRRADVVVLADGEDRPAGGVGRRRSRATPS